MFNVIVEDFVFLDCKPTLWVALFLTDPEKSVNELLPTPDKNLTGVSSTGASLKPTNPPTFWSSDISIDFIVFVFEMQQKVLWLMLQLFEICFL